MYNAYNIARQLFNLERFQIDSEKPCISYYYKNFISDTPFYIKIITTRNHIVIYFITYIRLG